jgi:hypothetical protein
VQPIDDYVTELDAVLRGPRRAKADLLAEARDHLVDATENYERAGLPRPTAERAATRDFGEVAQVAPSFQAELGLAQGRRTALAVLGMAGAQPFVWGYAFRWVVGTPERTSTADELVETAGGLAILLALLAVLAYRVGMRFPAVRARLPRMTGVAALATSVMFMVFSTALSLLTPDGHLLDLAWTAAFVLAPGTWVALAGRRCLALAR